MKSNHQLLKLLFIGVFVRNRLQYFSRFKPITLRFAIAFDKKMSITGAPKAFIDNGGSEAASNSGYVTAYDAETGNKPGIFISFPEIQPMVLKTRQWK